jgi:hypothetical protein
VARTAGLCRSSVPHNRANSARSASIQVQRLGRTVLLLAERDIRYSADPSTAIYIGRQPFLLAAIRCGFPKEQQREEIAERSDAEIESSGSGWGHGQEQERNG